MTPLLHVDGLAVHIRTRQHHTITPVRELSLDLAPGETLAVVGESGCGKSLSCLALAGLLPRRAGSRGTILLDGVDLGALPPREARRQRRRLLATVFQDATNGLNPVKTIGWQIAEGLWLRRGVPFRKARREAVDLLARVGMPDPARRVGEFPYQLSGGMNQRVMIALAIAGEPRLLIADEATTALDVTIQAQILDLLASLRAELGMGVIFVTHDLGLVAEVADHVAVMYAGRVVERAPVRTLFAAPRHPYTAGLLASLPRVDRDTGPLTAIDGQVPSPEAMPPGCAFAPRCGRASERCRREDPALVATGEGAVACHHPVQTPSKFPPHMKGRLSAPSPSNEGEGRGGGVFLGDMR